MPPEGQWSPDERRRLALVLERNVAALVAALRAADADEDEPRAPLAVLLAACTAGDAIDEATSFAVARARTMGSTWHEIGEVLAITRQAAQQRFGDRAAVSDRPARNVALAKRASEIVEQIAREEWTAVTADWNAIMRSELPLQRLQDVWRQITATAGPLQGAGRATVRQRGPYRIADVPLVFRHGPMRARITFDHDGLVAGLFAQLPDTPEAPAGG